VGGEARAALRSFRLRSQADHLKIVGLLLAAGTGSRFGSDKLSHALPHGVSIAVQAARHLKTQAPVVAVVRSNGALAEALQAEGCRVVVCENAAEGMGASLACGARETPDAEAWLVALGDMPYVRPTSIAAVRSALEGGAALAAPFFRARRGHPVGIGAKFREDLLALAGDEGAKALLSKHSADLLKIPVGDPGVIRDIDRPEDLAPPLRV
jgi:molybdenum cofactor cytidylyltransferase